jgi:hypothetical protein
LIFQLPLIALLAAKYIEFLYCVSTLDLCSPDLLFLHVVQYISSWFSCVLITYDHRSKLRSFKRRSFWSRILYIKARSFIKNAPLECYAATSLWRPCCSKFLICHHDKYIHIWAVDHVLDGFKYPNVHLGNVLALLTYDRGISSIDKWMLQHLTPYLFTYIIIFILYRWAKPNFRLYLLSLLEYRCCNQINCLDLCTFECFDIRILFLSAFHRKHFSWGVPMSWLIHPLRGIQVCFCCRAFTAQIVTISAN